MKNESGLITSASLRSSRKSAKAVSKSRSALACKTQCMADFLNKVLGRRQQLLARPHYEIGKPRGNLCHRSIPTRRLNSPREPLRLLPDRSTLVTEVRLLRCVYIVTQK